MSDISTNSAKRRGRPPRMPVTIQAKDQDDVLDAIAVRESAPERPAMRPSLREDDPRAAAARRAAEIRGHLGGMDEGTDEFRTPEAPPGWEYEWKRRTLLGQEDPAYQVSLARMGWEPVPASRHPSMMPESNKYLIIERKGMVLMERPTELVEEARLIERRRALGQVRAKESQLAGTPDGTLSRDADPRTRPNIKKGYEPMSIPD